LIPQQVNRVFDEACSRLLNTGFSRLQTKMMQRFQSIKSRMPRRESARRNHPLACESDIVETVHMRLTLLHMTFGKHIERRHCCFFPGEVTSNTDIALLNLTIFQSDFRWGEPNLVVHWGKLQANPTLQSDWRAVWSLNHGYGVFQGQNRAYTSWNIILWSRFPWIHQQLPPKYLIDG